MGAYRICYVAASKNNLEEQNLKEISKVDWQINKIFKRCKSTKGLRNVNFEKNSRQVVLSRFQVTTIAIIISL